MLLRGAPTTIAWSLAAIRGQYLRSFAVVMLIAYPPALARQIAFGSLRADEPGSLVAVALLDAAMSVLLMLLATAVYLQAFRHAERGDARDFSPVTSRRARGAGDAGGVPPIARARFPDSARRRIGGG